MVTIKLQVYSEHVISPQQQLAKIISKSSFTEQPTKLNVCILKLHIQPVPCFVYLCVCPEHKGKAKPSPLRKKNYPTLSKTKHTQSCPVQFEKNIYRWCLKAIHPSLPFLAYLEAQKQAIVRKKKSSLLLTYYLLALKSTWEDSSVSLIWVGFNLQLLLL